MYLHEPEEFEVARSAYRQLIVKLDIAADLGSLTTAESRNLVRKVELRDGHSAVLKVCGNTREPGEGDVLAAWYELGLPCVEPLAWGYEPVKSGVAGTASYLLTSHVDAPSLAGARRSSLADKAALALRLVDFVGPFHSSNARVPVARSWERRLDLHLRWTLPALRNAGLEEPHRWNDHLRQVGELGNTTIHGDPAGGNVLDTPDGLLLLDPPGALRAVPEADIAQICCQSAGPDDVEAVLDQVLAHHPRFNPDIARFLAGMNLLVVAGYVLAEHENPDAAIARAATPSPALERAEAVLSVARRLADRPRLAW
jgi:hypothetical protein